MELGETKCIASNSNTEDQKLEREFDVSNLKIFQQYLPGVKFSEILKSKHHLVVSLILASRGSHTDCFRTIAVEYLRRHRSNYCVETCILANLLSKNKYDGIFTLMNETASEALYRGILGNLIVTTLILNGCSAEFINKVLGKKLEIYRKLSEFTEKRGLLDRYDSNMITPVIASVLAGNEDCLQYLLESGADVNIPDMVLGNLFDLAKEGDNSSVPVKREQYEDGLFFGGMKTPVIFAICVGKHKCLDILLKHRPNLAECCCRHMNALGYAGVLNDIQSLEKLLMIPVEIDKCVKMGQLQSQSENEFGSPPSKLDLRKTFSPQSEISKKYDDTIGTNKRSRQSEDGVKAHNETSMVPCDDSIPTNSKTDENSSQSELNLMSDTTSGAFGSNASFNFTFCGKNLIEFSPQQESNPTESESEHKSSDATVMGDVMSNKFVFQDTFDVKWDSEETKKPGYVFEFNGKVEDSTIASKESPDTKFVFSKFDKICSFDWKACTDKTNSNSTFANSTADRSVNSNSTVGTNSSENKVNTPLVNKESVSSANDTSNKQCDSKGGFNFSISSNVGSSFSFTDTQTKDSVVPVRADSVFSFTAEKTAVVNDSDNQSAEANVKEGTEKTNSRNDDDSGNDSSLESPKPSFIFTSTNTNKSPTSRPKNKPKHIGRNIGVSISKISGTKESKDQDSSKKKSDKAVSSADSKSRIGNAAEESLPHIVKGGNLECVKMLINHCGDMNKTMFSGHTALMVAAEKGNTDILKLLINNWVGIDKISNNSKKETALMIACENGSLECVKILIDNGANVNFANNSGETALIYAVKRGKHECLCLLLAHGAKIDVECRNSKLIAESPLMIAAKSGQSAECIKTLLDHKAPLEVIGESEETALMYAIRGGDVKSVQYLLEHGANVEHVNIEKLTPLNLAVILGFKEIVEKLLKYNACIETEDKTGFNAFVNAAKSDNQFCLELIVEKLKGLEMEDTAEKKETNTGEKTETHMSVEQLLSKFEEVELDTEIDENKIQNEKVNGVAVPTSENTIVQVGSDDKHQDNILDQGDEKIVNETMLNDDKVSGQVNRDKSITRSDSIFVFGAQAGDKEKTSTLVNLANLTLPYSLTISDVDECFELILPHCNRYDATDKEGMTTLMIAAKLGKPDIIKRLITCGADPNYETQQGASALVMATNKQHVDCVKTLLESGARISKLILECQEERHPIISAACQGNVDILKLLIRNGANVNIYNSRDKSSPMSALLATYNLGTDKKECFDILQRQGARLNVLDLCGTYGLNSTHHIFANETRFESVLQSGVIVKKSGFVAKTEEHVFNHTSFSEKDLCLAVQLLMKYDLFDWSYWIRDGSHISDLSCLALNACVKPDQFECDEELVYPLQHAIRNNSMNLVRYLVRNLYFTLDEYRIITSEEEKKNHQDISKEDPTYRQLCNSPWRLETVALLTISSAMFANGSKVNRAKQVETLPIPQRFKTILSFQGHVARLLKRSWYLIGRNPITEEYEDDILCLTRKTRPLAEHLKEEYVRKKDDDDFCYPFKFSYLEYEPPN